MEELVRSSLHDSRGSGSKELLYIDLLQTELQHDSPPHTSPAPLDGSSGNNLVGWCRHEMKRLSQGLRSGQVLPLGEDPRPSAEISRGDYLQVFRMQLRGALGVAEHRWRTLARSQCFQGHTTNSLRVLIGFRCLLAGSHVEDFPNLALALTDLQNGLNVQDDPDRCLGVRDEIDTILYA